MSFSEYISPLVGRLVLAWFFLSEALHYAGQWDATVELMAFRHMPAAPLLLALGFIIVASVAMHDFWRIHNPLERAADFELFARNIAIAAGLLLLVGMGPGPIALDSAEKKKPG